MKCVSPIKVFLHFSIDELVVDFSEYLNSQFFCRLLTTRRVTDVTVEVLIVLIDSANFGENTYLLNLLNLFESVKEVYMCALVLSTCIYLFLF